MPTANGHITLNTPVIVRSSVFSLVKKKEKIKLDMPGFEPRTFLAAQPKLCARPLGQAGAAGVWGV